MYDSSIKQALQMGILRFGGIGIGAIAQIFAIRQLGPEKMGISGMALALVAQGSIFSTFGSDPLLVREYKVLKSEVEKMELIKNAFSTRLLLVVCIAILASFIVVFIDLPKNYYFALACVFPLVLFQSNQALWLLQAQEKMTLLYFSSAVGNLIMAIIVLTFIHRDSPAGSELFASIVGSMICFFLSWKYAINSLPRIYFNKTKILKLLFESKWLLITGIVIYGYTKLEQPLIGMLRSVEELGIYRSALQITLGFQPFIAIFPAIIYPKLIDWREASIDLLWKKQLVVFSRCVIPVIMASLITIVIIPIVFPLVFGDKFKAASIPCALLIVSQYVIILNTIFAWGLWAAKKDKTVLLIMAITTLISLVLNISLVPHYGMIAAASVNLFSEIFVLIGTAFTMQLIVNSSKK